MRTEFVIRSGDGFLVDSETFEMVSNVNDPSNAARGAKRYTTHGAAWRDLVLLQDYGIDAAVEPLVIGEVPQLRGPGFRFFRCGECGNEWIEPCRDRDSPSGESCDCGEWCGATPATTEQYDRLKGKV